MNGALCVTLRKVKQWSLDSHASCGGIQGASLSSEVEIRSHAKFSNGRSGCCNTYAGRARENVPRG